MILVALGGNLPSSHGAPRQTCETALKVMETHGLVVAAISRWYCTAPVPRSDDPWFLNGVARIETTLTPREVLEKLLEIELLFGRRRSKANAPRTLDLDLLAYDDVIVRETDLVVPHPRLTERAFVLLPLADVAPDWRHPVTGDNVRTLISRLPEDQQIFVEEQ